MTTRVTNVIITAGDHASRPAAATTPEGALYSCTDHDKVYRNNGTTWDDWAVLAGGAVVPAGGTAGQVLTKDSGTDYDTSWAASAGDKIEALMIAVSDETTAITTGTAKVTFRMPWALTLTAVRASLTTASSSGNPTVDINEAGSTILSTKLSIDSGEKTSTTAATPPVISDSALADDAEITIDIDTAGTGATGLKVYLIGTR